jgi:anaerobic selenocysteine-containing dehydrogenase
VASSKVTSACPLDCPDACSLVVTVEGGRVVSVDGDRRNPLTQGFVCGKVRRIARHVHGAHRISSPAVRVGTKGDGRFEPVSWDEALGRIVEALERTRARSGGEAILPFSYGGSNGLVSEGSVDRRLFRRLGASRLERAVCAAPTGRALEGLYGRMPGVALQDYRHSALIVLWGCNPQASGIHLIPILKEARRRGARLVVVDPRRTSLAAGADLHVPLRPGTDLPVALALVRWLFETERADLEFLERHALQWEELRRRASAWTMERAAREAAIDESLLRRFGELYAEASPAVIRCGWGPERNRNGGSATATILALPAVAGKLGVRGGGFTMSNSRAFTPNQQAAIAADEPATRRINMNRLGRALTELTDPPVEALFVYDCNPLATMPEQSLVRRGLAREDLFTVVFDAVLTDTARYADVLLPATTFLEHDDLGRSYGANVLTRIRPAIEPVGPARPNHAVFAELCHRLGLARPGDPESAESLIAALLDTGADASADPIAESLASQGIATAHPLPFIDTFPGTADRKIHLVPSTLDQEAPGGLYGYQPDPGTTAYPLALVSPARASTVSSTFGQLDRRIARLSMHPSDAAARGVADGDVVRIWNDSGEVRCPAQISDETRPGVVVLPKGLWSHQTLDGNTANALVPDTLADLGGGATFNDARVQVERFAEAP